MKIIALRKIAIYERKPFDDLQKETIFHRQQSILNRLSTEPSAILVGQYVDVGVSGMIPFEQRPAGKNLLRDAKAHHFDEIWVWDASRLGRNCGDLVKLLHCFKKLNIKLFILSQEDMNKVAFNIQSFIKDATGFRNYFIGHLRSLFRFFRSLWIS